MVAPVQDSTTAYSGVPLLEDAMGLKSAIESKDWASVAMGAVGTALDALSMVMDPFGSILAAGVGWLMEHVGPLKEALNALTGNADEIAAQSQTWANVAKELESVGQDLDAMVKADLQSWTGPAGDAYRQRTQDTVALLQSAQKGCEGASSGVKTAGEVVGAVRSMVRDIIAQLVGHMISWALQVLFTLGIGMAWVVPEVVAAVAKTASQIASITKKLVSALKALVPLLKKAGTLFEDAAKGLKGLKGGKVEAPPKPKVDPKGGDGGGTPKGGDSTETSGDHSTGGGDSTSTSGDHSTGGEGGGDSKGGGSSGDQSTKGGGDDSVTTSGDKPGTDNPPSKGQGDETKPPDDPGKDSSDKDNWICKTDPVDVARGNVVVDQIDLELPSPLLLERLHVSSYRDGRWFGPTWVSTVDQRLEVDGRHLRCFSPDGTILFYPHPAPGAPVLPLEGPRRPLARHEDGSYTQTDPLRGRELRFGALPGRGSDEFVLLAITDADGARVEFDYDPLGAPRALRHSAGYRVELETDGGRVTGIHVTDPEHDVRVPVRRFGYSQQGHLTSVVNSSGRPERYDYDADGRITGWEDRNGTWYRYIYDADGRCVRTVGDRGFYDGAFVYDPQRRVTVFTDSLGHPSEFHFNEANQLLREVDQLGHATTSEWDRYDRLLSRTDPLGRTTRYEYTGEGALTTVIRPDGSRARVTSDPDGTLTVTVTSAGRDWQRVYPAGTAPDPFTAQAGTGTRFQQDRQWTAGQPAAPAADPVERDLFGRQRVVTGATGARTRLGWTVEGLPATRTGPSGRHEEWHHDAEGNLVEHAGIRYEYGPFDLPTATIDATGARTAYVYDTELRLTRVTNPAGLTWSYTYDSAGRLVEETDFDGRVVRYGYDAAGQLVQTVDGLGTVTTYRYDALGNVAERRTPSATTTYAYDPVGFLVRAVEAGCVLEIDRDESGRVVREAVDGHAVIYTYDDNGVRRRTPSGVDSAWNFADAGATAVLSVGEHVTSFQYDEAGREVGRRIGAGAELSQTFDAENQLTGQTVTAGADGRVVQQRQYTYRLDGSLIGVDDAISGPARFQLDPAGRVVGVEAPGGAEAYRYDPSGSIVGAEGPVATPDAGPRSYSGNLVTAAGAVRYVHDRQGRLVARHETGPVARSFYYAWDPLDRLVGVRTPDGAEWRYRYDPLGRRIAKQRLVPGPDGPVVAEETRFTWSGQLLVEQVHRGPDGHPLVLTWDHRPGTAQPVAQTEHLGSGVRFFSFLTDQIGTPVDLIDERGVVAWHGSASLWGRARPAPASAGSTPLRFPGQYADDETGLHYNVYRYYDPGTGRYLSQDPLGLAPAPNPVAYVANPLRDSDPLGLGCMQSKPDPDDVTPNRPTPAGGGDAGHVQDANPHDPASDHGGSDHEGSDHGGDNASNHDGDNASSDHGGDNASDHGGDNAGEHGDGNGSEHGDSDNGGGWGDEDDPFGGFGMDDASSTHSDAGPHHAEDPNPDLPDRPQDHGQPNPALSDADKQALNNRWDELKQDSRYDDLAKDEDHGGQITDTSRDEALIGLDLNKQGIGPFKDGVGRPDSLGGGDLIDGNGKSWDVKSMHSDWPPGSNHAPGQQFTHGYSDQMFTDKVDGQLGRGRNVVIDTRNMSAADVQSMTNIRNGRPDWDGKIIFYP
ncbi:DUF6531 domain-containing protein [Amycolatopsis sp. NBC_00345]|uniref:RHS repeat-associated core domain-containing protein n=1 Tax=Amycolatopsis sp. NBC_00345 TaxID=2975955 RepID=UPI002E275B2E